MTSIPSETPALTTAGSVSVSGGSPGRDVVNPAAIGPDALARMLGLPAATVHRHVDLGAPRNQDGTMNLIQYAAWLNQRLKDHGAASAENTE